MTFTIAIHLGQLGFWGWLGLVAAVALALTGVSIIFYQCFLAEPSRGDYNFGGIVRLLYVVLGLIPVLVSAILFLIIF